MSSASSFHRRHQSRWQSGQRPNFDEALSQLAPGDAFPEEAFRLAKIELRFRLLSDDPRPLDDILRSLRRQAVEPTRDQLGELASQEYLGRWDRGEITTRRSEYLERFPQLADEVAEWRPQWECPACTVEQINELDDEQAVEVGCSVCSRRFQTMAVFPPPDPRLDHRPYQLLDEIGTGGMGVVYRAVDPALARELALKKLHPKLIGHHEAERRFEREARILGDLQHPGIVPLHSFGRLFRQYPFFTMKLVRGRTFDTVLSELSSSDRSGLESRIDVGLEIFEKICQAIAFAHERNVVHRDLKPANVMVGQFGEVQVMDWGLAKRDDASCEDVDDPAKWAERDELLRAVGTLPQGSDATLKTSGGRLLGTVVYMPREQAIDASTVGPAADVFALGAILCEILTGAPPCLDVAEFERLRALEQDVSRADRERIAGFNAEDTDPRRLAELKRNWEQVCQERDRYVGSLRLVDRVRNGATHVSRGLERLEALERSRQSAKSAHTVSADLERDRPRDPLVAHLVPLARACLRDDPAARPVNAGAVEQRVREFFQAVREDAAERRLTEVRRRQSQVVLVLVSFLALVAIGAALWVNRTNVALQRQTRIANQRSRQLERQASERYMTFADAERNRSEGFLGLPWLGAALRETRDPVLRSALRRSIQTTMPLLPKVRQIYLHEDPIQTFEYGGNGSYIVTSSGTFARVWPVVHGEEVASPVLSIPHEHKVFHASLNKSGNRLLTMAGDGVNRLYAFPEGRLLHNLGIEGLDIQRSSFDASGQWCLGAALDKQRASFDLCVWDAASGELRHRLPHGSFPITAAVFSPDGTYLATIAGEEATGDTAWLWKLSDATSRKVTSTARHQPLQTIAFTHDGKHLATGGVNQEVKVWEVTSGALAGGPLSQPAAVRSLEFSHDDEVLMVRTQSDSLHFWQWKTKTSLPPLERYPKHLSNAENVVSSDRRNVLGLDPTRKALRVWSFGIRGTAESYFQQPGKIVSVAQSPDDRHVALVYLAPNEPGDESGIPTLLVMRRSSGGREFTTVEHTHYSDFTCSHVAFSPDSRYLWVSGSGVLVLDLSKEKPVAQSNETRAYTSTLSISADGRSAIVHGFGSRLYQVSLTGDELAVAPLNEQRAVTFSPSQSGDKILISTLSTGAHPLPQAVVLSRSNLAASLPLDIAPGLDLQQIGACARVFTPNADRVVVIGQEGEAVICNAKTGKRQVTLRSEFGAIQHAQFDPHGKYVLTYGATQVELYQADGERLQSTSYNNAIARVNFSPDGSMLVVASGNLAQVWDVETWEPITPYWDHDKPVTDAHFSPSGRYVVTVSADHIVRLWNIADEPSYTDEQLVELADFWSEASIQRGQRDSIDPTRYAQAWRNILERFPQWTRSTQLEDAQFHWEQIQYCEAARDWKAAVSHWKSLLASDTFGRHATYWQRYGYALAQVEDWPEVNKAMRRANELAPDNPFYLEWLGYSRAMLGEREAATEPYRRAEALGRNNVVLMRAIAINFVALGRYAEAASYYRKARRLEPLKASNWRHEGAALLAAGMQTEFQEFANELSESGLMNSSVANQAGDVLATLLLSPELSTEIRDKLTPVIQRVGRDLPNDLLAWLLVLEARRKTGASRDFENSAIQSIELQNEQIAPRQWLLLAMNARRRNDVKQRDEYLAKADAWLAEARASQAAKVSSLTLLETEALRREYASTEGANAPAADVPDDADRLQQAITRLDGEITAQPDDARLRIQRGELLARLALIDEARADWRKAAADFVQVLNCEPSDPHWYRCLGLCLQMAATTESGARAGSVDEAFAKVTRTLLEQFNKSPSPELLFEYLWLSSLRNDLTQAEFQMTVTSNAVAMQMLGKLWDANVATVFSNRAVQIRAAQLGIFSGMLGESESFMKMFQERATEATGPQALYDWYGLSILRAQSGLRREARLALESGDAHGNGRDVQKAVRELPWHQQVEIRVLRNRAEHQATSPNSPAAAKP